MKTFRTHYNGMNRVHALKFTATGGPDGILQNLSVVAVRRNDRIGLRNSRINTKLENAQNNRGVPALQQGITYADKGFVTACVGIEIPFCKNYETTPGGFDHIHLLI